jgi:radical SAM protein with 4Fe4S-binding SPASM domain
MRNPQSFNRYVYAGNNPLAAIDPKVLLPIDFIAGLNISVLQIFVLFGLSVWLSNVSAWSIPEIRGVLRWEGSRVNRAGLHRKAFMENRSPISILQLHVTERCNKRCTHCYHDDSNEVLSEMHTDQLISLIDNFELICQGRNWRGQVTFAGGEPFIRPDFMPLLREVARRPAMRFAILTNGTFIDERIAQELAALKPTFVQISIEGGPPTHDAIRGKGDFHRSLRLLSLLKRAHIRTLVSFTAHRANYREFPVVAQYVRQSGGDVLWSDRLVPVGRGSQLETLTPAEARSFFEIMDIERLRSERYSTTKIRMHRSLQFLCGGEGHYRCSAGRRLLAVMPDGVVYPCRRLPIALGNVLTTPLEKMYESGEKICDAPSGCSQCDHFTRCQGGARCIAYAVHGKLGEVDPGCWVPKTLAVDRMNTSDNH